MFPDIINTRKMGMQKCRVDSDYTENKNSSAKSKYGR